MEIYLKTKIIFPFWLKLCLFRWLITLFFPQSDQQFSILIQKYEFLFNKKSFLNTGPTEEKKSYQKGFTVEPRLGSTDLVQFPHVTVRKWSL